MPFSSTITLRDRTAGTAARWRAVVDALPRGRTLPVEAWERRHRTMLAILWVQVVALPVFALFRGAGPVEAVRFAVPIAVAGLAGSAGAAGRRARSVAVALGLLTACAVLVHAWNGRIEAHFSFFVVIAVMALYEDWLPFGMAFAYVVAEHGIVGVISPHAVYDHGGDPWMWAAVHGGFVLAAATANVVTWALNEEGRAKIARADEQARETAERFRLAFETGVSGMALVAPDGAFLSVNGALASMLGYAKDDLVEMSFQSVTHAEDLPADVARLAALSAGTVDSYDAEKRYVHRDGHDVWVRVGVSPVRDEAGTLRYFITQMHDVTQQRLLADDLAHHALHDPLTGLANRVLFEDRLRRALVRLRRHPGSLAVVSLGLDRFKRVNDGLGHAAGDAVLAESAIRISGLVRADDTVARIGGDEFVILSEDTTRDEAVALAERVIVELGRTFAHDGRELHLTASVGVRVVERATDDADAILRDADDARYSAKSHGRGRCEVFEARPARAPGSALKTEEELRIALRDGELRVHYQPCLDLTSGEITTFEALVRWEHPVRGLVPPGEFIPAAEDSGLVVPLGEWVLREACHQIAEWRRDGTVLPSAHVAVNVSGRQICSPELPETVGAALAAANLSADGLCLEITESAMIADPALALANVAAIKRLGVALALDDFGVGFSSLAQIRDLPPVDVIKIDRSFVGGLTTSDSDAAVVLAVLGLGRALGLTVVAEGVETPAQLERLRALGCDVAQGFHIARPQSAADVEVTLRGKAPAGP